MTCMTSLVPFSPPHEAQETKLATVPNYAMPAPGRPARTRQTPAWAQQAECHTIATGVGGWRQEREPGPTPPQLNVPSLSPSLCILTSNVLRSCDAICPCPRPGDLTEDPAWCISEVQVRVGHSDSLLKMQILIQWPELWLRVLHS